MTYVQGVRAPRGFQTGFLISFFLVAVSIAAHAWFADRVDINIVAQLILPIFICFLITRDWLDTLTLLTINDICTSGISTLLDTLELPAGRSYLFVATMGLTLIFYLGNSRTFHKAANGTPKLWILFYGLVFPFVLVAYSVILRGTRIDKAFWDVHFIAPILLYFPIRRLIDHDEGFFRGWMIALAVALSILAVTISLSPLEVATRIMVNWGADMQIFVDSTELGYAAGHTTIQGGLVHFIITYIGYFFGTLYAVDFKKSSWERALGAALGILCIGHLLLDFLRGPVLAAVSVTILASGAMAIRLSTWRLGARIILFLTSAGLLGVMSIYALNPVGIQRYTKNTGSATEYIGGPRIETAAGMFEAFLDRPLMGQGLGVPPPRYRRLDGEGPINFEMQYYLGLYRFGLIGFLLFMLPLAWLYWQLFRPHANLVGTALFDPKGKFRFALLLSALTTTIAGATNPYLKTGFLVLIVACYWAYAHHLQERDPVHFSNS